MFTRSINRFSGFGLFRSLDYPARHLSSLSMRQICPTNRLIKEIDNFIKTQIPHIAEVNEDEAVICQDILEKIKGEVSNQNATDFSGVTQHYINAFSNISYRHGLSKTLVELAQKAKEEFMERRIEQIDEDWAEVLPRAYR